MWLYLFLFTFGLAGIITWEGYYSLLPICAMVIDTIAQWNKETKLIRVIMLIPRPLWFVYDFVVGSYAGMTSEILVLCSILIGIFRFNIRPKKLLHRK